MPSGAGAYTSGQVSRWTHLTEPQLSLFTITCFGFLVGAKFFWNHNRRQSLSNKFGLIDMEAVRLVLNDGSTGVVTLTVVDALPLAELEGLLEFRHVFCVDGMPVSGEVAHLDEDMSLRSRLIHQAKDARVVP